MSMRRTKSETNIYENIGLTNMCEMCWSEVTWNVCDWVL